MASDGFLRNFLGIDVNLRRKISTKKLPLPQVGSNIFLSTAEISGSHKSHICLTMFSGVNTSPNSLTRCFDLISFWAALEPPDLLFSGGSILEDL